MIALSVVRQFEILLNSYPRGFHLITAEILQSISTFPQTGICHIFIQHTSAGIMINENADVDVRIDFEAWFDRAVKENEPYYQHTIEGSDDMPAHIKSSLVGHCITIPIKNHRLYLGTWQGIFLCEFRNKASRRKLIITLIGE